MTPQTPAGARSRPTEVIALIPAYSHIDHRLAEALLLANVDGFPLYECSDLPLARSQLLTYGLEHTSSETLLLIDSDIAPTPEQILQLVEHPKLDELNAVAGCYVLRTGRMSFQPMDQEQPVRLYEPGLVELRHSGLGFCAIRRQALARLTARLERVTSCGQWWPFCVPWVEGGVYYPDDLSLWERARRAGVTLWLDTELVVDHVLRAPHRPPRNTPVTRG